MNIGVRARILRIFLILALQSFLAGGLASGLSACDDSGKKEELSCEITSPADGAEFIIEGGMRIPVETRVRGPVVRVEFQVNDVLETTLSSPPYTYDFPAFLQDPGTFRIRATAYDANESTASDEIMLVLRNSNHSWAPAADFTASHRSIPQDRPVHFFDDSTQNPTSWRWDFGDGQTSEERDPFHIYAAQGVYTVTLTAANEYGEDSEVKVDYIRVNAPLSGLPCPDAETVADDDGNLYRTVQIGSQCWMAENLRVGRFVPCFSAQDRQTDNGIAEHYRYQNEVWNYEEYGGLYEWGEAMAYAPSDDGPTGSTRGICPAGWHLPTDEEWKTLERTLGMPEDDVNLPEDVKWRGTEEAHHLRETGTSHWTTDIASTNFSGFTALPGGWRNETSGDFMQLGEFAVFWTATEFPDGWHQNAWVRAIGFVGQIGRFSNDMRSGASVRCIRD